MEDAQDMTQAITQAATGTTNAVIQAVAGTRAETGT